jgi:uncharacterized membrane protein (UPF0127 family)
MNGTVGAFISLVLLAGCAGHAGEDSSDRPPSSVAFEGTDALLYVDVADQPAEQWQGLMSVKSLPADQGMAFVFNEPVGSTFWMKDTLIPLSIAFVDEHDEVIGMRDMQPCAADPCPSYGVEEPYILAIEANLGWFDEHGVMFGARADLRVRAYG